MKVILGGDSKAWESISGVIEYLQNQQIEVENLGAQDQYDSISLVDFIPKICTQVKNEGIQGILLCGTGAGVEIGANRFKGIRASLCVKPIQAKWAREKDDANVLCLSSWDLNESNNLESVLDAWFKTTFDGDSARRAMLETFDSWVE